MNIQRIIIVFLITNFILLTPAIAQDLIPDLKGSWNGTSFLTADTKGIHTSNNNISLMILKQSGSNFSGNIKIQENDITKLHTFSASLEKHEGFLWYFNINTEGGVSNIGYLITNDMMKVYLNEFDPCAKIAIYRLTRDKPIGK